MSTFREFSLFICNQMGEVSQRCPHQSGNKLMTSSRHVASPTSCIVILLSCHLVSPLIFYEARPWAALALADFPVNPIIKSVFGSHAVKHQWLFIDNFYSGFIQS